VLGAGWGCLLPLWGSGYHPRRIFENSDANPAFWWLYTCCEISCCLKTSAKKLGTYTLLVPQPKSWGTSFPRSLRLLHLCVRRRCATFLRFLNCRQMLGLTYLLTLQGPRTERQTRSTCNWNVSLSAAAQQRDARHYETDGRLRWMSLASSRLFQKLASPSSRCRRLSNWSIVETTTTAIRPPRHVTRWRHTNSCILLLPFVLRAGPPSRYSIRFEPLPLLFSTKSATAMAALWRICVRENLAGIVRWSLVNTGLTSWTCVLLFEIFCSSFFLFKF